MRTSRKELKTMPRKYYDQDVQVEQTPVVIQPEESVYLMPTAAATYTAAELLAFKNRLLAALTKQTLDNTALLAAHVSRLLSYAPEGADLYRKIVENYADAAMLLVLGKSDQDDYV